VVTPSLRGQLQGSPATPSLTAHRHGHRQRVLRKQAMLRQAQHDEEMATLIQPEVSAGNAATLHRRALGSQIRWADGPWKPRVDKSRSICEAQSPPTTPDPGMLWMDVRPPSPTIERWGLGVRGPTPLGAVYPRWMRMR
jgi:hypothetical protein